KKEFIYNIQTGLNLVRDELSVNGFIPEIRTSHVFEQEEMDDPRAMLFGCTPDYNAWLGLEVENILPSPADNPFLRTAGGHLALGYDNPNREANVAVVKLADALLGIPSIILDGDNRRRQLYGKAGSYRHTGFGVEYRTLSSFWLKDEKHIGWAWDQLIQ